MYNKIIISFINFKKEENIATNERVFQDRQYQVSRKMTQTNGRMDG